MWIYILSVKYWRMTFSRGKILRIWVDNPVPPTGKFMKCHFVCFRLRSCVLIVFFCDVHLFVFLNQNYKKKADYYFQNKICSSSFQKESFNYKDKNFDNPVPPTIKFMICQFFSHFSKFFIKWFKSNVNNVVISEMNLIGWNS